MGLNQPSNSVKINNGREQGENIEEIERSQTRT